MATKDYQIVSHEELIETNGGWIGIVGLAIAAYGLALPIAYYVGYHDGKNDCGCNN